MKFHPPVITTITGDISPDKLGFCQCHEHLLIAPGRSGMIDPALCFDDAAQSAEEVLLYQSAGGSALVDAQPVGCGRMASGLLQIAQQTGITLIASTGFHKMLFYPEEHWIFSTSLPHLAELFIHELDTGMYVDADSRLPQKWIPAKAGIIKTALDACGLTEQYKKLFYAAAAASRKTGAPIMIHVEKGSDPLELLDFLTHLGIVPARLIFCHLDRACPDPGVHLALAAAGSYLEYDTIGRFKYHDDQQEIRLFQMIKENGMLSRLLFSLDTTRLRLQAYSGSAAVGLDYILRVFLPLLKEAGFSSEEIRRISTDNPRDILARYSTLSNGGTT